MGSSSSNLNNGIVEEENVTERGSSIKEQNEINNLSKKEKEKNLIQVDNVIINNQNSIKDCLLFPESIYSGGENLIDLNEVAVIDSKCKKINDEKYDSTCFLTPKKISVKGVDNPEKCKILYKAELNCEGDTVESFVNNSDNNMRCIIIAIILLIVFLYL